jgi:hypothetical protein
MKVTGDTRAELIWLFFIPENAGDSRVVVTEMSRSYLRLRLWA